MAEEFDRLCNELNIQISTHKNVDATQIAVVYGWLFDLENKTITIPQKKYDQYCQMLDWTIEHRLITGRALDSLTGKLLHWSIIDKNAKSLVFNAIYYINQSFRSGRLSKLEIYLVPLSLITSFQFWRKFAQHIRTNKMQRVIGDPSFTLAAVTDASTAGAGLRKQLTGKSVLILMDNSAFFGAYCNRWSSSRHLMIFIYEICLLAIEFKIQIRLEWISTHANIFADALSRMLVRRGQTIVFDDKYHKIFWDACKLWNVQNPKEIKLQYFDDFKVFESEQDLSISDKKECERWMKWMGLSDIIKRFTPYTSYRG